MRELDVFLAVSTSKTLTDAANVLNLSVSTVSYNLKKLETTLGVKLIDRGKGFHSIKLTSAGNDLLQLALKWDEVMRNITTIKEKPRYLLSIGSVESMNHCFFPSFFQSLRESNIDLKIGSYESLDMYKLVENKDIDVAFVVHQIPSIKLDISVYNKEKMMLITSSNPKLLNSKIKVENLNPYHEVYVNWSLTFQIWHNRVWSNFKRPHLQINSIVHLDSLLSTDPNYWVIAPESVAIFYKKRGFKALEITPTPPERVCYKLTHINPSPSIQPALDVFNEALSKWNFNE